MKRSKPGPLAPIAIAITSEQRADAERVWEAHNRFQPVPSSKSSLYRAIFDAGLRVFKQELAAHGAMPTG